jgi:hypothetical protein
MTKNKLPSVKSLFLILGWAGMLASVLSVAYGWIELKPRMAAVTNQIKNNLGDLSTTTQDIAQDPASARLASLLPNALTTLHGTLLTTSETLYGTAKTTNDVKKGLPGIVMPKKALRIDTNRLSETGNQLRLLADVVEKMETPVTDLSNRIEKLPDQLNSLSSKVADLNQVVDQAHLPFQTALLCSAFSVLYFLIGGFCFISAFAVEAIMSNRDHSKNTENETIAA